VHEPPEEVCMITDPVTGFAYPESWVRRCHDERMRNLAASGLGVLSSSGHVLRRGFTTGTTAAAACKAAILSLAREIESVDVRIPCGLTVSVQVSACGGTARALKDSGDYRSDVTNGLEFVAVAQHEKNGIWLQEGEGIGRFVRNTPRFAKGAPAISQPASSTILHAMEEGVREMGIPGASVTLSVPRGAEIAHKTLNPKIGIEGGISVLGSTGLVEPWDDHYTASALERIRGKKRVVLTTGRTGLRYSRMFFPDDDVVLVGAHLQEALDCAEGEAILCGLPGLILKFINPGILAGRGYGTVEELASSLRGEEIIAETLRSFRRQRPDVRVMIVDRAGRIMGDSG
jgi:cobalt-precorrin-5B (C1)-methyltransferase